MKSAVKTKAFTRKQKNAVFDSQNAGPSYRSGNSMVAALEEARKVFEGEGETHIVRAGRGATSPDEEEADCEDDDGSSSDDDKSEDGITNLDLAAAKPDASKLKRLMHFVCSDSRLREDVERAFALHIDRKRADVFRPQWHAADFEPAAIERYVELQTFLEQSGKLNSMSSYMRGRGIQVLFWLNCHLTEHRLVGRDIDDTFAFVGLSFLPGLRNLEIDEWRRSLSQQTKLVDNDSKAFQDPYYKDWRDASDPPKDMWPPTGRAHHSHKPPGDDIPREWKEISRPQVARL